MQEVLFDEIQPTVFKKLSAFFNYFCLSLEESWWVMQVQSQYRFCHGKGEKRGRNRNEISIAEMKYLVAKEELPILTIL